MFSANVILRHALANKYFSSFSSFFSKRTAKYSWKKKQFLLYANQEGGHFS